MIDSINEVPLLILFINVLFSIRVFKGRPDLKWFEITLIWSFIIQILADVLAGFNENNLPLLHLYTLLEFIFISLFYYQILFKNLKNNHYFYSFTGLITLILIANSIFYESIMGFNSNAKGLTQIIIISYAIIYFFNRISIDEVKENLILNRINAAILLYYAGSLFIFIFAKFLMENALTMDLYFWRFNMLLYLVFQILILIARWRIVFPKSTNIKSED